MAILKWVITGSGKLFKYLFSNELVVKLNLKNVTLIGIDCVDEKRLEIAFNICEGYANFGSKKLITQTKREHTTKSGIQILHTNKVKSLEDYSRFVIKDLNKYVNTTYALVIQYDGFILNPDAWTNDFLKYDYIGAPLWIESYNIQNGGFSLRSKKLLEILSNDKKIKKFHPEDVMISKDYKTYLEKKGIVFAPETVASKFSIEGFKRKPWIYRKRNSSWNGQFGFHGFITNIERWNCNTPEFEKYFNEIKKRRKQKHT